MREVSTTSGSFPPTAVLQGVKELFRVARPVAVVGDRLGVELGPARRRQLPHFGHRTSLPDTGWKNPLVLQSTSKSAGRGGHRRIRRAGSANNPASGAINPHPFPGFRRRT